MKWRMLLITAMGLLLFPGCLSNSDTDVIDGGVRHFTEEDLPKEIRSTEITYFQCWFSSLARPLEDTPVAGQIFELMATSESVTCKVRTRERETVSNAFVPDGEFFVRLQDIVSRYEFSKHNGQHHRVSGLPPHYGIKLEVRYASGEEIRISDNQNCFLSNEAMEELAALFQPQ